MAHRGVRRGRDQDRTGFERAREESSPNSDMPFRCSGLAKLQSTVTEVENKITSVETVVFLLPGWT